MRKGLKEPSKPFRRSGKRPDPGRAARGDRKKAVNLTLDGELLAAARALKINLSEALTDGLKERIRSVREAKWREDHRAAIENHNKFIDEHGIWSRRYRTW